MADISQWWMVQWCPASDSFQVQTVADAVEDNARQYFDRTKLNPYIPLGIFETREEAGTVCSQFMADRDRRLEIAAAWDGNEPTGRH